MRQQIITCNQCNKDITNEPRIVVNLKSFQLEHELARAYTEKTLGPDFCVNNSCCSDWFREEVRLLECEYRKI